MFSFLVLIVGIILLLMLVVKFNVNTFVSLVFVAVFVGLGLGIPVAQIPISIMNGIGGTIDELAIVFGFGAIIGRLVADSGGAYRISKTLVEIFGEKNIQWAILGTSFVVGISLFIEVGMLLLIPIVFAIALEAKVPLLYLGIPMTAGLVVTHGLLPPHPAPTAVSGIFGVNAGIVLVYGFIVAIPTVLIGGPIFTKIVQFLYPDIFIIKNKLSSFGELKEWDINKIPSFKISLLTSLMPVILLTISTIYSLLFKGGKPLSPTVLLVDGEKKIVYPTGLDGIMMFLGNPVSVMIISLLFTMWSMGWLQRKTSKEIATTTENAIKSISMLLLIICGGAALKQVLIDGGISIQITKIFENSNISPLILAWIITVVFRIILGSATIAALTSAGLISGIVGSLSPKMSVLMVLTIGVGSIAASHVNDAGFWMYKEYFDLNIKQTLKTWTILNTIISITGFAIIMLMSIWIY